MKTKSKQTLPDTTIGPSFFRNHPYVAVSGESRRYFSNIACAAHSVLDDHRTNRELGNGPSKLFEELIYLVDDNGGQWDYRACLYLAFNKRPPTTLWPDTPMMLNHPSVLSGSN